MSPNLMVIMRGIHGSGKTTFVKHFITNVVQKGQKYRICSADHFFIGNQGNYVFDATKLHDAHQKCYEDAKEACFNSVPFVFIDNTNILLDQYQRYIALAEENGYTVLIFSTFDTATSLKTCAERNVHSVPHTTINKMFMLYERDRRDIYVTL
jgi:predicted kinase